MKPYLAQFKQIVEEGRPWVGFSPTKVSYSGFQDAQAHARRSYTTPVMLFWVVPAHETERMRDVLGFEPATTEEAIAAGLLGIFQGFPVLTDARDPAPWLTRLMLVRVDLGDECRVLPSTQAQDAKLKHLERERRDLQVQKELQEVARHHGYTLEFEAYHTRRRHYPASLVRNAKDTNP